MNGETFHVLGSKGLAQVWSRKQHFGSWLWLEVGKWVGAAQDRLHSKDKRLEEHQKLQRLSWDHWHTQRGYPERLPSNRASSTRLQPCFPRQEGNQRPQPKIGHLANKHTIKCPTSVTIRESKLHWDSISFPWQSEWLLSRKPTHEKVRDGVIHGWWECKFA